MLRYLILTGAPASLSWCEGITLRGDVIAALYAPDSATPVLPPAKLSAATVQLFSRPEEIQIPEACDAVLIAGSDPRLLIAAKHLGQAGLPLLVVTTDSGPTSALFELVPLWEEGKTLLVAGFSSGIEEIVSQRKIGRPIERIEFVRHVDAADSTSPRLPESVVHRWFFQDVRWLTKLATQATADPAGSWERVQTVWTGQRDNEVAQGMVTLSGESVPETHWIIRPATDSPEWKLTIWSDEPPLVITSSDHPAGLAADVAATLERFSNAIHGSADQSWNDVLQCGHLLAAAQRSAQRQRKVPVHFEEVSERSQFKTQMSAIGCGVLLWAMFGIIFMLAIAGTMDPRDREQRTAQAAGFVLSHTDFTPETLELSESGQRHLQQIAADWSSTTAPIVFDTASLDSETVQRCQEAVREFLEQKHLEGIPSRLVVRPVTGIWFERVIFCGWAVVFGPLAIFLLAQLLISVSHPGRHESNDAAASP